MEINDNRKREIAELAEYIANEYCPSTIVDPEIIARGSGITFNYGEYGDAFDGLLEHESGDFHIYLRNPDHGRPVNPFKIPLKRYSFTY